MKTNKTKSAKPKTLGVRLESAERALIESAAALDARPGDRGGVSAWARRVLLAAAHAQGTRPPVRR